MYGGSGDTSRQMRREQEAREAQVRSAQGAIEDIFGGFTPEFYAARRKAYMDYAMPEIAEQYQEAKKNLTYSLAGKGLLKSGAASSLASKLERELAKQEQSAVDTAYGQSTQFRGEVEDQQSRLLAQAFNALDPSSTVVSAMKTASQYREPQTAAPLGRLFQDWTQIYATKKAADYYGYNTQPDLTFGTKGAAYNRSY